MKTSPLIFSSAMVNALLDGRKTQTRRPVNGSFKDDVEVWKDNDGNWRYRSLMETGFLKPPKNIGDLVWVRETFCIEDTYDYHNDHCIPDDGRPVCKPENDRGEYWLIPHYRATEPEPHIVPYYCDADDMRTRWKPSIFMPRWTSRITLRITDVRVERLQDISEEDAMAESCFGDEDVSGRKAAASEYAGLWESIHGQGSWELNPWVWAYTFEVIRKNVDEVIKEKI